MREAFKMKVRQKLSADGLFGVVRQGFEEIEDHRPMNVTIPLADALMAGFAMFSLKEPSLLTFDQRRAEDENLKSIYGLEKIPSDTQMRTILDQVEPDTIKPLFKDVFRELQRGKVLEQMVFMGSYYLVSLDGTGYFTSKKVHCAACLERVNSKTGEITYSHQMLGGAIVHPDRKEVIPLAPEPIIKQDGETKNDCERNAAKRFLAQLRQDHPHLNMIVIEDALSANAPHIRELERHQLHYILGVKPGDHAFLFEQVERAHAAGETTEFELERDGVIHRFRWLNQVPLNASNPDLLVNFLEYWEVGASKTRHFTWITSFTITQLNAHSLMRGGRARWKIENETFNTLKNQGYQFEHNFGHGQQNLSVVFALLMMLAFAVDQAQQLACSLFQAVWRKQGSKRRLWEDMRALFFTLEFASMADLFRALLYGYHIEGKLIIHDSS
jgi:hypothetical protein